MSPLPPPPFPTPSPPSLPTNQRTHTQPNPTHNPTQPNQPHTHLTQPTTPFFLLSIPYVGWTFRECLGGGCCCQSPCHIACGVDVHRMPRVRVGWWWCTRVRGAMLSRMWVVGGWGGRTLTERTPCARARARTHIPIPIPVVVFLCDRLAV